MKKYPMQMKNYRMQMKNYPIQMKKIEYCNVSHAMLYLKFVYVGEGGGTSYRNIVDEMAQIVPICTNLDYPLGKTFCIYL